MIRITEAVVLRVPTDDVAELQVEEQLVIREVEARLDEERTCLVELRLFDVEDGGELVKSSQRLCQLC